MHERMLKVYNDCSPTVRIVKRNRTSLEDDTLEGHSKRVSTPKIIPKIQDMDD